MQLNAFLILLECLEIFLYVNVGFFSIVLFAARTFQIFLFINSINRIFYLYEFLWSGFKGLGL